MNIPVPRRHASLLLGACIVAMSLADGTHARAPSHAVPNAMVSVPGGTFEQGSSPDDPDHQGREGPVRQVHLRPFALGRNEVTVGEFRAFVEGTGYLTEAERNVPAFGRPAEGCFSHQRPGESAAGWVAGRSWRDPGFDQDDTHPVVCISWNDAHAYLAWLREQTDLPYRLPTESEFEYAQRAGADAEAAMAPAADDRLCALANHADDRLKRALPDRELAATACDDGHAFSAPAGRHAANALGLHDMTGNVSEWTEDCWHETYADAPSDGRAWAATLPGECRGRVLRGGDLMSPAAQLRPANRTWIPDSFRTYHVGFRVALDQGEGP